MFLSLFYRWPSHLLAEANGGAKSSGVDKYAVAEIGFCTDKGDMKPAVPMRSIPTWAVVLLTCIALSANNVQGAKLSPSAPHLTLYPSLQVMTFNEYLNLRSEERDQLTLRNDETGLLTGNELLKVFYDACGAVRGVINLLNNPVFSVLGISGTVLSIPTPIPSSIFNPLGIPKFFQGIFLSIQGSINSLGKRSALEERFVDQMQTIMSEYHQQTRMLERKFQEREGEVSASVTIGDIVEAVDYPCQTLDVVYSFINNSSYIGWLKFGDWPLPLRDPLHKLNLLGVPGSIFSAIFG